MKETYIYVLTDPRDGRVRYVGKSNNPKARLRLHIRDSLDKGKDYPVHRWIRKLASINIKPCLTIIEVVSYDNWKEEEIKWIKHFGQLFNDLLNIHPGGNGCTDEYIFQHGEERYNSRLADKLIIEIRESRRDGSDIISLANEYNVVPSTISRICRGEAWKHVGGPITDDITFVPEARRGEENNKSKFTKDQVIEIRRAYENSEKNQSELAREYSVSQSAIWHIVKRKVWKHV